MWRGCFDSGCLVSLRTKEFNQCYVSFPHAHHSQAPYIILQNNWNTLFSCFPKIERFLYRLCARYPSRIKMTQNKAYSLHSLSREQISRYARQLIIPALGPAGQSRLLASSALVVGAGGLGSPLLLYLAAAGVGTIGVIGIVTLM